MIIQAIPADTSPEAFRVMVGIYRAMPASRRLELALQMSDEILEVAAAGIRQRHPEYTEEEVRRTLVRLRLGEKLFREIHDQTPPP
jgi:hypothetical protein